jgi:hypothetical protein
MEGTTKTKRRTAAAAAKKVVEEAPTLLVEEVAAPPVPVAPKRTKKPTGAAAARKPPVVATVTPDGIVGCLSAAEPRPLIAHLPIRMSDIDSELFGGGGVANSSSGEKLAGSEGVEPFDVTDHFVSLVDPPSESVTSAASTISIAKETAVIPTRPTLPMYYSEKLMVRFLDANREQRLPESTEVACYWDCHPFRGTPCVIPVKIEEDIWQVYGNFCCPECAAAYLFNERLDSHVQWERYALLNRLYAGGGANTVRLASPRAVLRLFGGNLDVSEYRALVADKRMRVDVMLPPMISITQVMDTKPIDFYDATVKNNFIPWEMDRMNRPGAQGLRLRRTKPVAEKEATLEWCMGITA